MASEIELNSTQTISPLTSGTLLQTRQETVAAQLVSKTDSIEKKNKVNLDDTVSLSPQLQQALADVEKKDAKKSAQEVINKQKLSNSSPAKVEVAYDLNGELITKYLDTANRLVYQSPSEMMLFLKESESKSKSALNTTA